MANQIERPQLNIDIINTKYNIEDLQYTAGVLDTDGCFLVMGQNDHNLCVKVSVTQAEKGCDTLHYLYGLFGGIIKIQHKGTKTQQASYCWYLLSTKGIEFCKIIASYMYLKKREAIQIIDYPTQSIHIVPIIAVNDNTKEKLHFDTLKDCIRHFNLNFKLSVGDVKQIREWKIKKALTQDELDGIVFSRAEIKRLITEFKNKEHDHIPTNTKLSIPYVAGVVEGDGCLDTHGKNGQHHNVVQKYRVILDVLKNMFGGNICWRNDSSNYSWDIYTFADEFLAQIAPYLRGKRKQADLIMNMKPGTAEQVHVELNKLKGFYFGSTVKIKRTEDGNGRVFKAERVLPRGVHKMENGKYKSLLRHENNEYTLGYFKTVDEAREQYLKYKRLVVSEKNGGTPVDFSGFTCTKKKSNKKTTN